MSYTLSVIIPNYNNQHYIEQCVGSVLTQSYEDLVEVVVVDDCSTDNSREIIRSIAEKNKKVRPLFLTQNGHVSNARNKGVMEAKGEYITCLDSDDFYYDQNKLKKEMELIIEYDKRGIDIVSYSAIIHASNDGKVFSYPKITSKDRYQGKIFRRLLLDLRSEAVMRDYCVKKSVFLSVGGYNPDNHLFEDYELLLKLSKIVEFYFTDVYGTAYRKSIGGLSDRRQEELVRQKNRIIMDEIMKLPLIERKLLLFERETLHIVKNIAKKIRTDNVM